VAAAALDVFDETPREDAVSYASMVCRHPKDRDLPRDPVGCPDPAHISMLYRKQFLTHSDSSLITTIGDNQNKLIGEANILRI